MASKEPFCTDCARSLSNIGEYAYMLKHPVWAESVHRAFELHTRRRAAELQGGNTTSFGKPMPMSSDLCCVTCLEERLGRTLRLTDFNWDVSLNIEDYYRSPLLQGRMKARK